MIPERRAMHLGRIAYQAYGKERGWLAFGSPIPQWADTTPGVRHAWIAAAQAAVLAFLVDDDEDGPES